MTQTFIDMLVAIKDPAAIEKAYNILAAKRELLKVEDKPAFQHTSMEPRPIEKTYSQVRLEHEQEKERMRSNGIMAGDYVEIKGATPAMQRNGFSNGQQFRVIRKNRDLPDSHVIAKSRETGNFASINVAHLERVHPSITFR